MKRVLSVAPSIIQLLAALFPDCIYPEHPSIPTHLAVPGLVDDAIAAATLKLIDIGTLVDAWAAIITMNHR